MPRKAGGNAITLRDRAIKQGLHRSLQEYGDKLRWEVLDLLRDDVVSAIAKAVRGDPPFNEPKAWAIHDVLEMAKILGPTTTVEINMLVLQQLGVASIEDARKAVAVVEDAEGMDAHDRAALAVAELMEYRTAHPDRYSSLMEGLC